ncbi:hypothetical protein LEP1GSC187_1487 [Leptospira santarosai str. ZUN179]|uniref:Uncharacterized protein n=1 Tax=Leptospira santarosai str. ZUN179 TaxID=1049985 RepID=M6UXH6_9LEPT|nr:hypothetical protein LEP1GSC187_1487 [Leptospira santarosai str. ZUN179]
MTGSSYDYSLVSLPRSGKSMLPKPLPSKFFYAYNFPFL